VCGFENLDPELQSSIVSLDIPDQVVAQFLLVSFAKQLRVEFLGPEQEFGIAPVLPAGSFQLRQDAVARVWHKQSETLDSRAPFLAAVFHILREDLPRPLDGAKPHASCEELILVPRLGQD
jgi:hypothetical protein